MDSSMHLGTIVEYDQKTMSARVVSSDGSITVPDAAVMLQSLDYGNGSYQYSPPIPGSTCIFSQVGSETIVLGYYLPRNLGGSEENQPPEGITLDSVEDQNPDMQTVTGMSYTRSPSDFPAKSALPGDNIMRGPGGAEIGFLGNMYKVYISPLLYSVWNSLNSMWDVCCNMFFFRSPGLEIQSVIEQNKDCNIQVTVRESADGLDATPVINLQVGKNANIINMQINGQPFLYIDKDRNVTLQGNRMIVDFKDVDFSSSDKVRLP